MADTSLADEQSGSQSAAASSSNLSYVPQSMGAILAPGVIGYAAGVRMGSFIVYPTASATVSFDDNVFNRSSNRESDVVTSLNAQIATVSDWSRHGLELHASGGTNVHSDFSSEDVSYGNVGGSAVIDVFKDLWFRISGDYSPGFERRGTGESFSSLAEPIDLDTYGGRVVIHKQFNRLWLEGDVSATRTTYDDARVRVGGVVQIVDQSFRSGTTYDFSARAGYEFSPKTSVFLEGGYNRREFEDIVFDSDGHHASAGLRYEFTRLLDAEFAVGYLNSSSKSGLDDVDTWTYRANLAYHLTPLMVVSIVGTRGLTSPSQISTDSNRVLTDVGLRWNYAIKRDVTVNAGFGLSTVDYIDNDRNEDTIYLTTGASYQFRPWLSLWANYLYETLETDSSLDDDYSKNVISAGVSARY
ncbi:MAG: outer membrane beta-barrel protein [Hyphomicrobium sp.]